MNINWLKSHSAPPHRLAEIAAIFCATSSLPPFVRNAVVATSQKALIRIPYGQKTRRIHGLGRAATLGGFGIAPTYNPRPEQKLAHHPETCASFPTAAGTARAHDSNTGIETCMGKTVLFEIGAVSVLIASAPP